MIENYITQVNEGISEIWNEIYQTSDEQDEVLAARQTAKRLIFFISKDLSNIIGKEGQEREAMLSIASTIHEKVIEQIIDQWQQGHPAGQMSIAEATREGINAGLHSVNTMLKADAQEDDPNGTD